MAITIIQELGTVKISGINRMFCKCKCNECGSEFTARADHVKRKKNPIKSCGCKQYKKTGRTAYNAKPIGVSSAKSVYNSYKSKCKTKKILFDLSFDDFLELTSKNCYYCDAEPKQEYSETFKYGVRAGLRKVNGTYKYNGIDRIDPNEGYKVNNIVPCCRYCNTSKLNRTQKTFYTWIKEVHANLVKRGEI